MTLWQTWSYGNQINLFEMNAQEKKSKVSYVRRNFHTMKICGIFIRAVKYSK